MNLQQVKAVFDSFSVEARYPPGPSARHLIIYSSRRDPKFYIAPMTEDWDKEHPRTWMIFKMGKIGEDITITDEFELQDWLINEYRTN